MNIAGEGRWPRQVFRCFDQLEHARLLVDEGIVWISTLEWLRTTDRLRGNAAEATVIYEPGLVDTEFPDETTPIKLANLANLGIIVENGGVLKLHERTTVRARPRNGYLYCTSTRSPSAKMRRIFGDHCVRIADARLFERMVTEQMMELGITDLCYSGQVHSVDRVFKGTEVIPAWVGFLGERENEFEAEFRFYWPPASGRAAIQPFPIQVPEVKRLCSMS